VEVVDGEDGDHPHGPFGHYLADLSSRCLVVRRRAGLLEQDLVTVNAGGR